MNDLLNQNKWSWWLALAKKLNFLIQNCKNLHDLHRLDQGAGCHTCWLPWFKFVKVTRIQPTAYSETEKVRLLQFIHYVPHILLYFTYLTTHWWSSFSRLVDMSEVSSPASLRRLASSARRSFFRWSPLLMFIFISKS